MDWGDLGSLALGGPLGYLGYKGYQKQQDGNDAQNAAMAQARAGLGDLQKTQRLQRGEDLNRALSMFGPVDDYLSRMYGVEKPRAYIDPAAQQTRSGPGHFGAHAGSNVPPPPPSAASPQAMLGAGAGPYRGANSGNMQMDSIAATQAAQAARLKRVRGY